jgi:membrane protein
VLTVGFLLLVSMLLTAGLAAFTRHFSTFIPEPLMQAASFAVSFAVVSALFTLMFKWLPDAEVDWRDVWLGGVGTAALFEIVYIIGKQGLESTYGASASIVVVLIWVYYTAQIVLFGAEFTHVRAKTARPAAPGKRDEACDDWCGAAGAGHRLALSRRLRIGESGETQDPGSNG